MFYFCTYFDSNYLIKGMALYRSLVRHANPFKLWVLCFDDLSYEILQKLAIPEVIPISLRDFEEGDKKLLQTKRNRSKIEYYFTCTPSLPLFILKNFDEVDMITYLDADLFFFSNPSPIYEELADDSILILEHRFAANLKHLRESVGIYNVSILSFRRDKVGLQCLNWWRNRCLEWCYDRAEDGRYADQKYVDDWPRLFPHVAVLQHKGAGLAPWNIENYYLHSENGEILVDSQRLVLFHFQGLKKVKRFVYNPNLSNYGVNFNSLLKHHIYGPYLQELYDVRHWIFDSMLATQDRIHIDSIRYKTKDLPIDTNNFSLIARKAKSLIPIIKNTLRGDLWLVIAGRVI